MKPFVYLQLIMHEHEGFNVVSIDLLEGGTKRELVDSGLSADMESGLVTFVYGGCTANGYVQI